MAQPFATCSVTLRQEELAQALVHIAHLSMWCEVQPLPDELFEVRVKEGEGHSAFPEQPVQHHAAALPPALEAGLIALTHDAFQMYREQHHAWTEVRQAVAQAWSPAALDDGVAGVVTLIKQLAAAHPDRAKEVKFGGWVLRQSQDCGHPYLYASRGDRPGEIHLKADDEGFVADVWPVDGSEAAATCAVPYSELGEELAQPHADAPRQRS